MTDALLKMLDESGINLPMTGNLYREAAAAIRKLRTERDDFQNRARQLRLNAEGEQGHMLRVEVESLRAELEVCKKIAEYREALIEKAKEYVRHKQGCAMYTPVDASTDCDCGLSLWVKQTGEE